jgi:ornithine carbamoyltransferase
MYQKRDFLDLQDYSALEIRKILDLSKLVKKDPRAYAESLKGKEMVMIFQKTSTRTRVSFEAGMHQLGGNAIYMDWRTSNLMLGCLEDEIKCISRYCDLIMARVYDHGDIIKMAKSSKVPVINGLSDYNHPCQALADIMTIEEQFKDPQHIKFVFIGDGANNVAHSLIVISTLLKIPLTIISPPEYSPSEDIRKWVKAKGGSNIEYTHNIDEGIVGADVIYTDTFVSMGQEEESTRRLPIFRPYQVNSELIKKSGKTPMIMHCLPAHRDIEITADMIESDSSIVFDQSENRMHTEKALMLCMVYPEKYL